MRVHALPWMPIGHLRWRLLVHVHKSLPDLLLHQVPGLHQQRHLQLLLRLRPSAGLLLHDTVRRMRRQNESSLPVDHLPRPGPLQLEHPVLPLMNAIHEAGFAGLGFLAGLVALWSP